MNFKPIELQISMPRTTDVGQQQQQLAQKPVMDQAMLGTHAQREAEKARTSSTRPDETAEGRIRDDANGNTGKGEGQRNHGHASEDETTDSQEKPAPHPYKGRHFDITF